MTQDERNAYVVARLYEYSPTSIFDHYQAYGSKFGIYYFVEYAPGYPEWSLTAKFTPIGYRKDWETNDEQFKSLVDAVLFGHSSP